MSSSLIWKASALGGVLGGTSRRLISFGGGGGGNDWLSSNTLPSPETPLLDDSSATEVIGFRIVVRISLFFKLECYLELLVNTTLAAQEIGMHKVNMLI